MEIILALGIFILLSAVVIDIFFSSGREQRRGVSRQQVVASARTALELIARDIRLGGSPTLYPASGQGAGPVLSIRFPDNSQTAYFGFPGSFNDRLVSCHRPANAISCDYVDLTTERAKVLAFKVFITPSSDPLGFTATEHQQPRITIALTVQGTGRNEEQVKTTLQTTVVPRLYAR